MKKLALLIACVFTFTSCSIDDDGPSIVSTSAEVSNADLPEYFEKGETYEVEVTYLLPTSCHTAAGLQVTREGGSGEEYRNIYIIGVANIDANLTECNEEGENLEETDTFSITIDKDEPYTFNLWTGVDVDNENTFESIVVPVGAPDDEGTGNGDGEGENTEG